MAAASLSLSRYSAQQSLSLSSLSSHPSPATSATASPPPPASTSASTPTSASASSASTERLLKARAPQRTGTTGRIIGRPRKQKTSEQLLKQAGVDARRVIREERKAAEAHLYDPAHRSVHNGDNGHDDEDYGGHSKGQRKRRRTMPASAKGKGRVGQWDEEHDRLQKLALPKRGRPSKPKLSNTLDRINDIELHQMMSNVDDDARTRPVDDRYDLDSQPLPVVEGSVEATARIADVDPIEKVESRDAAWVGVASKTSQAWPQPISRQTSIAGSSPNLGFQLEHQQLQQHQHHHHHQLEQDDVDVRVSLSVMSDLRAVPMTSNSRERA